MSTPDSECPRCHGTGRVYAPFTTHTRIGGEIERRTCGYCNGAGFVLHGMVGREVSMLELVERVRKAEAVIRELRAEIARLRIDDAAGEEMTRDQ